MTSTEPQNSPQTFEELISVLRNTLYYVEDKTFTWDDAVAALVIQLTNTDSINKDRKESHATQIQLTAERNATESVRKTEDFFPTLTLNSTFKQWRISIPARINNRNIDALSGKPSGLTDNWRDDSIQIRRRILNDDGHGNGNPTLHICYENDLMPLREILHVGDYLVIIKGKNSTLYDAFGVKSEVSLGSGKQMYLAEKASSDSTTFSFGEIDNDPETAKRIDGGRNVILYGVPGSGKSWSIEHDYCPKHSVVNRLVFHPDYTNADFIGQILPVVDKDKQVTYEFTAGPFTAIIRDAYKNPKTEYILIIEEINRGNAPAIFGETFQLLDRLVEQATIDGILYPIGTSEYEITNANMAEQIYGDPNHKVRIPSNLSIIATMNTSDQNVFTLDTAFQRRWHMRLIENSFDNVRDSLAKAEILDTGVTWQKFCETINSLIINNKSKMASAEDKRLGVYFIHENDIDYKNGKVTIEHPTDPYSTLRREYNALLKDPNADLSRLEAVRKSIRDISIFPEKVIKYLWDDAFKFNPDALFNVQGDNKLGSLEDVINVFVDSYGVKRFDVFKPEIRDLLKQ